MFTRLKAEARAEFTRSLSLMLKSGITLDAALTSLGEQATTPALARIMHEIGHEIQSGTPFSKALKKREKVFGPVLIGLVEAGEESGTLEENLFFLSEWFERSADLEQEVKSATLYPKIVFGAAVLLGGSLTVFILPRLVPLFSELNVELPLITKILLAVAVFIENYWFLTIAAAVLIAALFILLNRIVAVQRSFHTLYIRMPFIGRLLRHYQLALITQLFSTLLKSGLTLSNSIEIVSKAATNMRYTESLSEAERSVLEGNRLSSSLKAHPALYPQIVSNIVEVGEASGALSTSFQYLSEFYTKSVNTQSKRLPTIIEPILLTLIALMVGLIALSIILPIYTLTGSIT